MLIPKPVVRRCTLKEVLLKISQNSQENTCARVSFLLRLQTSQNGQTRSSNSLATDIYKTCVIFDVTKYGGFY